MSRSTQFVGLTDAARAFAEGLEPVARYVGAHGMFGEDIELGRWRDADGNEYLEVVQADPWSSGPCIFTCLEMRWANEEKGSPASSAEASARIRDRLEKAEAGTAAIGPAEAFEMLVLLDDLQRGETRLFEWTLDPTLKELTEWDSAKGAYWI